MRKTVTLVGHCLPDSSYLTIAVRAVCPDVVVERANNDEELDAQLATGSDLLLVNRRLDGDFDDPSGIELIARCRHAAPQLKSMLISNYADAQQLAQRHGAVPGFGKAELGTKKALDALVQALDCPTL